MKFTLHSQVVGGAPTVAAFALHVSQSSSLGPEHVPQVLWQGLQFPACGSGQNPAAQIHVDGPDPRSRTALVQQATHWFSAGPSQSQQVGSQVGSRQLVASGVGIRGLIH